MGEGVLARPPLFLSLRVLSWSPKRTDGGVVVWDPLGDNSETVRGTGAFVVGCLKIIMGLCLTVFN